MRRASLTALVAALALLGAWLAAVLQHPLPLPAGRALLTVAVIAGVAALVKGLRARLAETGARPSERRLLIAAIALTTVALALRFSGLDHEIGGRYYQDEGTYLQHATKINGGEPIRDSFVYPHLLYYAGAFAIWCASLVEAPLRAATSLCWPEVVDWPTLCRFLLRALAALAGALVVLPTVALGRRLAGPPAGLAGGALIALSPLWDEGAHLGICDVPSAFFATLCLAACARWLDDSSPRVWIAAGVAAGLAAGAKYPAGLVALAIVAVALRDLLAPARKWLALPIAGSAALASFLAVNPSLLFLPGAAFLGERSVFFGAIQYSTEGWLGVSPDSRALWYGAKLAESFGWPALVLGFAGVVGLGLAFRSNPPRRARLAWLLPFPIAYAALLVSLPMAVERNLYPVLPFFAVLLGIGVAALVEAAAEREPQGRWVAAGVALVALAVPAVLTLAQAISFVRPSTRDLAVEWLYRDVPRGLTLMTENYGPNIPRPEFVVRRPPGRFAAMLSIDDAAAWGVDVVVLAEPSWSRFFDPKVALDAGERSLRDEYARYRKEGEPVARFEPGRLRRGPALEALALPLALRALTPPSALEPDALVVPDDHMRDENGLVARADGEWVAAVLPLRAGTWRVGWEGRFAREGEFSIRMLRGRAATVRRTESGAFLDLPEGDTVVAYLKLAEGDLVRRVTVAAAEPESVSASRPARRAAS